MQNASEEAHGGRVAVDLEELQQLSEGFRSAAANLRARIDQFRTTAAPTGDAFGKLGASRSAAVADRDITGSMLDNLGQLHRDLENTADALAEAVRQHRTALAGSVSTAQQMLLSIRPAES
ncbi:MULTISPECIES: hypothetical protein [Amycolatopsis]|uniref:ESX-1 secretion-associated protein n=1 Tax=Amycolatopsis albidoflavus TaxID=102226 RepID=A0ABW5I874_9PSEU